MSKATVTPLPDGRFQAESQGWRGIFHEEDEAVEEARRVVQRSGGGVIYLLGADGRLRDGIEVTAAQKQAGGLVDPALPEVQAGEAGATPGQRSEGLRARPAQSGPAQPVGAAFPPPPPDAKHGQVPQSVEQPEFPESVEGLLRKGADKAIESGLRGWWLQRSENERVATGLIGVALALGPLGQGALAAVGVLFKSEIPTSKQVEAMVWLLWITAPLAAFVIVLFWLAGKHASVPVSLIAAGAASVAAAASTFATAAPKALAGVYCYADFRGGGVVYEQQCRAFNNAGFIAENSPRVGSPSSSVNIFSSAVTYTADARGTAMALAAILAGIGIGLLIREHS